MIVDSHCHLEHDPMISNLDEVIQRAFNNKVKYLLSISTTNKSFLLILEIVKKYKNVYGTYGIHPHETKNYKKLNSEEIINQTNLNKKIIGIGETGLDYYYEHTDSLTQKKVNKEMIFIEKFKSIEKDLKSEKKNKNFKVLIHCFTGSKKFAHKLIDLGCYISASGVVTFKKSNELADTFLSLPNDKILVETDSPYLSPEPLRGKPNEPSHIVHTVNFLAKLKNMSPAIFAETTTSNFFKLFGELK